MIKMRLFVIINYKRYEEKWFMLRDIFYDDVLVNIVKIFRLWIKVGL